nr:TTTY14 [Pan troglodytes]
MGQSFSCSLRQRRVGESEATLRWTEIFSWGGASGLVACMFSPSYTGGRLRLKEYLSPGIQD